jgi:hypothetical protein
MAGQGAFVHIFVLSCALMVGAFSVAAAADKTVVVPLHAMSGSGQDGTATLRADGTKTIVTIKLTNGSSVRQPDHFHVGNCDKYQPRPLYPLQDVVNGTSTTTLDVPLEKLIAGDMIINIHKSYDEIATQAACGTSKG